MHLRRNNAVVRVFYIENYDVVVGNSTVCSDANCLCSYARYIHTATFQRRHCKVQKEACKYFLTYVDFTSLTEDVTLREMFSRLMASTFQASQPVRKFSVSLILTKAQYSAHL